MRKVSFFVALLLVLSTLLLPRASFAQFGVSISLNIFAPPPVALAPPPLPVYVVPAPPAPELVWTPGYWAWTEDGYCWIPGTWVAAPVAGVLWTPAWWGWENGAFAFHAGYWGPHIGFYGGINYGGGYNGSGFNGGAWQNGHYIVNRSVTNVTNITNVTNVRNVSFNGGPGGISAQPTAQQSSYANEKHYDPTEEQRSHITAASQNPQLMASANHGKPAIAATPKPGDFSHGIAAKAAGRQNAAAQQHNNAVMKDPSLAKGGAMPKAANAPAAKATAQPRPGEQPAVKPVEAEKPAPAAEHPAVPAATAEHPAEAPARPAEEHPLPTKPAAEPMEKVAPEHPAAAPAERPAAPAAERPAAEHPPAAEKPAEPKPEEKKPEEEAPAEEHHD